MRTDCLGRQREVRLVGKGKEKDNALPSQIRRKSRYNPANENRSGVLEFLRRSCPKPHPLCCDWAGTGLIWKCIRRLPCKSRDYK